MAVSRRLGLLAFAKQTALGTPAAAPTYALPIVSGGLRPNSEDADLPLTADTLKRRGRYRQRQAAGGVVRTMAFAEAIGLPLYHVMGAQAVSGASAPFTHTFTMADDVPRDEPLTFWRFVGDHWLRFSDAFIRRLTLEGQSGENIEAEMDVVAFDFLEVPAPAYAIEEVEPRYKFIGSAIMLEADSATPVEVDNVGRVGLVIDRNPDVRHHASLTPNSIAVERNIDFSATLTYDPLQQGWDFNRVSQMGSAATGGGPNQSHGRGSFDASFGRHPILAGRELRVASAGDNWEYVAEWPDADPGGGSIEIEAGGMLVDPGEAPPGPSEVTVTLINETAGTY